MFRRLLDITTRPILFAAALAREAIIAAIVYWVTRSRRGDEDAPVPPRAP